VGRLKEVIISRTLYQCQGLERHRAKMECSDLVQRNLRVKGGVRVEMEAEAEVILLD
jgi:uncharacterized alkaline shock family protein YloU